MFWQCKTALHFKGRLSHFYKFNFAHFFDFFSRLRERIGEETRYHPNSIATSMKSRWVVLHQLRKLNLWRSRVRRQRYNSIGGSTSQKRQSMKDSWFCKNSKRLLEHIWRILAPWLPEFRELTEFTGAWWASDRPFNAGFVLKWSLVIFVRPGGPVVHLTALELKSKNS